MGHAPPICVLNSLNLPRTRLAAMRDSLCKQKSLAAAQAAAASAPAAAPPTSTPTSAVTVFALPADWQTYILFKFLNDWSSSALCCVSVLFCLSLLFLHLSLSLYLFLSVCVCIFRDSLSYLVGCFIAQAQTTGRGVSRLLLFLLLLLLLLHSPQRLLFLTLCVAHGSYNKMIVFCILSEICINEKAQMQRG